MFGLWKKKDRETKAQEKRHDLLDDRFRTELSELYFQAKTGQLSETDKRKVLERIQQLEATLLRKQAECARGAKA